jgi:hypothetical protein
MITLNTEKGLTRIATWEDVLTRPGFTVDIDPKTAVLKSIIGSYAFQTFIPCGLASCHTPHGRGYLVVTSDGRETNIGKDCGKKYFSVDFERLAKVYDRDLRSKERREALTELQHQIPGLKARILALKNGDNGANWIHRNLAPLRQGLPSPLPQMIQRMVRQRDGTLTRSRPATAEEMELMRAQGQRVTPGQTIEESAGQLAGLAALYEENDLRELLVKRMEPLDQVEASDVDTLPDKALRELAKWAATIEPTLAQAEAALAAGRRLLTQTNLRQLDPFLSGKEDRQALATYLQRLPA